ncbi:MAG: DUF427 domain-containing protein [Chloroflexota bacterium]|nr:DUF427 domain-containing protein [Chloroflexota bacterium]
MSCKATWNGEIIAASDRCITTEGNLYFPPDSVKREFVRPSSRRYTCFWKGEAGYYDLVVKGKVNKDAAWYYDKPSEAAKAIKDYVSFDRSLEVKVDGDAVSKIKPPWE